ncbi:MAG TPA: hypothetical protein VMF89_22785 [Polyangiales bacterium]|nr:hypothetical protein [Polyangiales bacterium]
MTYNGHTNYETWAVSLYLDGNYTGEGTYREVLELAEQHLADSRELGRDSDDADYTLAEALKDYVETDLDISAGLAGDLVGAALSEVDWRELAKDKLAEAQAEA